MTTTPSRHETARRFLAALAGTGRANCWSCATASRTVSAWGQLFDRPDLLCGLATYAIALGGRTDVYAGCAPRTRRRGGRDAVDLDEAALSRGAT